MIRKPKSPRQDSRVIATTGEITLPTYLPAAPDKNPMFLEKRVYQGSSGRVYPLPFIDRIAEQPVTHQWQAVWLENEFLKVLVLPEIGGRIHAILDKTNGYDVLYNQPVIKPALVGLAGPWISGGIEFNWPQHHRPATFLPVNYEIEKHTDGSVTVWCSDHDPMCRMKGMHGVCLHPGQSVLELKARAYNRTPFTQTFLWWANVATQVHEAYQSFFPPDVYYVADHAKRATSEYPLAEAHYYGVNYGERGRQGIPASEVPRQYLPGHCHPAQAGRATPGAPGLAGLNTGAHGVTRPTYRADNLSFYANIPVPTSYMCMGSKEDFFGGYDYKAEAGIVHIANHHISPGKKQWTWGNHEFGYAWDRNLTDADANGEYPPYIEIMAGVYTDNQPDFSFLQPGETKTWSQYWYPIQKIGPARHANLDAAIALRISSLAPSDGERAGVRGKPAIHLGIAVTRKFRSAKIVLTAKGKGLFSTRRDLIPGAPMLTEVKLPRHVAETDLRLRVLDQNGNEIISHQPRLRVREAVPPPAAEPSAPAEIASIDELYLTGLHLEQYRHATRSPLSYWQEALRRDPLDSRCNNAVGLWHLRRGEFAAAETRFRNAIERLTRRNPNPADGEAHYHLGLCLRHQSRDDEAYAAFYKACWNQAWMAAGYHAIAEIDCTRQNWSTALEHLNRSLQFNTDNLRARNLKAVILRQLNRPEEARELVQATLALDPLDWWARWLRGDQLECDSQVALDIAHDHARAGRFHDAILLLCASIGRNAEGVLANLNAAAEPQPTQSLGADPLIQYTLGWLLEQSGELDQAKTSYQTAALLPPDYCFPARLEEIAILEAARRANPRDAKAPYYLGNLFYDRRRHDEAIKLWEKSAKLDPTFSVVWRNLGIGYFNIRQQPAKARAAYDRAFRANPSDGRLLFERDQLWKRLGEKPAKRLRELEKHPALVQGRDDLSIELCALYNQTGQPDQARARLATRNFQPWEGGEGGPLGQWVRTHLILGRRALETTPDQAADHFSTAFNLPLNLGEARHLLANQSDVHYWLGCALAAAGDQASARKHWTAAANFKGDFQNMSVRAFSEMTYYSALAWEKLGQQTKARQLFRDLLAYARQLGQSEAKIDYFATSLPTMLLFDDDIQFRQQTTALFLQAQARLGLGQKSPARQLLRTVLQRDPNHSLAFDLAQPSTPA